MTMLRRAPHGRARARELRPRPHRDAAPALGRRVDELVVPHAGGQRPRVPRLRRRLPRRHPRVRRGRLLDARKAAVLAGRKRREALRRRRLAPRPRHQGPDGRPGRRRVDLEHGLDALGRGRRLQTRQPRQARRRPRRGPPRRRDPGRQANATRCRFNSYFARNRTTDGDLRLRPAAERVDVADGGEDHEILRPLLLFRVSARRVPRASPHWHTAPLYLFDIRASRKSRAPRDDVAAWALYWWRPSPTEDTS